MLFGAILVLIGSVLLQIAPPIIALIPVIPLILLSASNIYFMMRGDSDD